MSRNESVENVSYTKIVRTPLLSVFLLVLTLSCFSGCDSVTTTTDVQDIVEARWAPDGSAIYGFMQKFTVSSYSSTYPAAEYMLTKFNADGTFNKSISTDQQAQTDISFSVYPSADASKIITQVGQDLYQINTASGSYSKIYQQFHLLTVSPDLHYAVGSVSPSNRSTKTVVVADITANPARIVKQFDVAGIALHPGVWVGHGRFALTLIDSIKYNVTIFDTTGVAVDTIGGAEVAYHNLAYFAASNSLYIRNQAQQKNDGSVDKVNLTNMQRTNVLPQAVESFDISADEGLLVYNQYVYNSDSTVQKLNMFARNLVNGNQTLVTDDVWSLASLSPVRDRVAYIHSRDVNYYEVWVKDIIRP
jgi:hypothetical protein